jgi:outer membrane protein TolC
MRFLTTQFFYQSLIVVSIVLTAPSRIYASELLSETESLNIGRAVQIALEANSRLLTLNAEAEAMAFAPSQVGALPDPMLSFNAMNLPTDTFDLDQEPMTQLQLMLSQKFPFPGKRQLRREVAETMVGVAQKQTDEYRDVLTGKVREAWWRLFSVDRSLQIVDSNKRLLRDFVEIAKTKYAVGKGLQQDVLLAELELSRLTNRELQLAGNRRRIQAMLNGLLNRVPDHPITLPEEPPSETLPMLESVTSLTQFAVERRDLIQAIELKLEAADKTVELAEKDRWPDFQVGVGYADRQGSDPIRGSRSDFLSLMFSINLPLYSGQKQDKALQQRIHEREYERYRLSDTVRIIETEIGVQAAEYSAAREQALHLKNEIIPQAEQTVSAMLAGYEVNKVDFLNVVNGQIMLYNASIDYWNAMASAKQALARLAAGVGKESIYE